MVLAAHSIVGAALANMFPDNPAAGFLLAFASHYVIDAIPHREYDIEGFFDEKNKKFNSVFSSLISLKRFFMIGSDFGIGIILSLLIFARDEKSLIATLLGILGGVLPDALQFFYYKYKIEPFVFIQKYIHDVFHSHDKMYDRPIRGYINQIITVAVFILLFFLVKTKL